MLINSRTQGKEYLAAFSHLSFFLQNNFCTSVMGTEIQKDSYFKLLNIGSWTFITFMYTFLIYAKGSCNVQDCLVSRQWVFNTDRIVVSPSFRESNPAMAGSLCCISLAFWCVSVPPKRRGYLQGMSALYLFVAIRVPRWERRLKLGTKLHTGVLAGHFGFTYSIFANVCNRKPLFLKH